MRGPPSRPNPTPVRAPVDDVEATTVRNTGDIAPPPPDEFVGQVLLGQFKLLKRIGAGGFGSVYLAEQVGLGRNAVAKIAHLHLGADPVFKQRFQREATVLASLDHHHLVKLYNYGELPTGQTFLIMEYGGDKTLADEIKQGGPMPIERALRIGMQICDALGEAHAHGVVHRDLKPANVLVGKKSGGDWVKVVDVGIAKLLQKDAGEVSATLTAMGEIVGTPAYFSPEQARGFGVDVRSDIYSFGVVLYEMLTGKLPIVTSTSMDYVRAHAVDPPTPPEVYGLTLPPAVKAILFRCLEKEADNRYQSTDELRAALADAAGSSAGRTTLTGRQIAAPVPQKRAAWLVPVSVAAVVVGVLAAFALTRPGKTPPAPAKVAEAAKPASPHPVVISAAAAAPAAAVPAIAPPTSAPALPPASLLIRSPTAEVRIGLDGAPLAAAGNALTLAPTKGAISVESTDGKWKLQATYERTASGAALEVKAPEEMSVRFHSETIAKPAESGKIIIGADPAEVVLVNSAEQEIPLLFLFRANAAENPAP